MDLSEIQNTILDRRTKGIPGSSEPFPLKELKNKKWNILKEDMPRKTQSRYCSSW